MNVEEMEEFVEAEKILTVGLVIAAVMSIFIKIGFKFALTQELTDIVVYHRTVYPLAGGLGMVVFGYFMSRRYPKTANIILGIGSVIAILMFFILASLGGWLLFVIFCSLIPKLPSFVLTLMVFSGLGFLLAKSVEKIVPEFLKYDFATRRQLVLSWIVVFILPVVLVSAN